jgi:hypothetical protein
VSLHLLNAQTEFNLWQGGGANQGRSLCVRSFECAAVTALYRGHSRFVGSTPAHARLRMDDLAEPV